jgi:FKBP-type peptidyl-prolyl cis-trans isomerase FkpA
VLASAGRMRHGWDMRCFPKSSFVSRFFGLFAAVCVFVGGASVASAQSALIRGEVFLKQNAKAEGVKVQPSGLQIKILTQGTGRQPKGTDTVVVHYRGRLISGSEFDSSFRRGEPATFKLNQVIKGWTEGIQLLREGGKAELYIPAELAYGSRGSGASIGPDEALIFEVELIAVK